MADVGADVPIQNTEQATPPGYTPPYNPMRPATPEESHDLGVAGGGTTEKTIPAPFPSVPQQKPYLRPGEWNQYENRPVEDTGALVGYLSSDPAFEGMSHGDMLAAIGQVIKPLEEHPELFKTIMRGIHSMSGTADKGLTNVYDYLDNTPDLNNRVNGVRPTARMSVEEQAIANLSPEERAAYEAQLPTTGGFFRGVRDFANAPGEYLTNRAKEMQASAQEQVGMAEGPESQGRGFMNRLGHRALSLLPETAAVVDKVLAGMTDPKTAAAMIMSHVSPAAVAAYFGSQGLHQVYEALNNGEGWTPDNAQNLLLGLSTVAGAGAGGLAGNEAAHPLIDRGESLLDRAYNSKQRSPNAEMEMRNAIRSSPQSAYMDPTTSASDINPELATIKAGTDIVNRVPRRIEPADGKGAGAGAAPINGPMFGQKINAQGDVVPEKVTAMPARQTHLDNVDEMLDTGRGRDFADKSKGLANQQVTPVTNIADQKIRDIAKRHGMDPDKLVDEMHQAHEDARIAEEFKLRKLGYSKKEIDAMTTEERNKALTPPNPPRDLGAAAAEGDRVRLKRLRYTDKDIDAMTPEQMAKTTTRKNPNNREANRESNKVSETVKKPLTSEEAGRALTQRSLDEKWLSNKVDETLGKKE